jgi:sec-independent protein translocase protein TatA
MGLDNPLHIAFLLLVVLIVFGAKRLPEVGRSLGSGMRGFRDALSGTELVPSLPAGATVAAAAVSAPAAPAAVAAAFAPLDAATVQAAPAAGHAISAREQLPPAA